MEESGYPHLRVGRYRRRERLVVKAFWSRTKILIAWHIGVIPAITKLWNLQCGFGKQKVFRTRIFNVLGLMPMFCYQAFKVAMGSKRWGFLGISAIGFHFFNALWHESLPQLVGAMGKGRKTRVRDDWFLVLHAQIHPLNHGQGFGTQLAPHQELKTR